MVSFRILTLLIVAGIVSQNALSMENERKRPSGEYAPYTSNENQNTINSPKKGHRSRKVLNQLYLTYEQSEEVAKIAGAAKIARAVAAGKKPRRSGRHQPYTSPATKNSSSRVAKHSPRGSVKTLSGECKPYSAETSATATLTKVPSGTCVPYSSSNKDLAEQKKQGLDENEIYEV